MSQKRLSRGEFIALMAMMFSTIAFSIDAMLPALPKIAAALSPQDPNRAQLVLTSFVLGMGVGTLFAGPISDTFGRKRVLLAGSALYMIGAALGASANSLEMLLAARLLQGLGAAGPRIVSIAIIRDLYSGRQMAQLMSLVMIIFTMVPAFAPSLGALISHFAGWRGVFAAFVLFALIGALWLALRQGETLPPAKRRTLRAGALWLAMKEVLSHRTVRVTIAIQSLVFGALFGLLSSAQQIFSVTYHQGANFPFWFGGIALIAGTANIVNSRLVMRLGMRYLVIAALRALVVISAIVALILGSGLFPVWLHFPVYLIWQTSLFFMLGLTLGNLNAIAMEPMGHIAGMAASVVGALSTVLAVAIAAPLGLAFDGTPVPLAIGILICMLIALALMHLIRREPDEAA